jgi:zinc/manganese transport system substrate-binding protein
VHVFSVESNPNTDPHSYEVTPSVARRVAGADLLVENGVGYDGFMQKLASASKPRSTRPGGRRVLDVARLLRVPDTLVNPHLWYDPMTMPAVANALAADLSALDPAHASAFDANASAFVASLQPWFDAIASVKARFAGSRAATSEPVADDLLAAMGIDVVSPLQFQLDVMNGTDPSPQDLSVEEDLLTHRRVKVFCYNQQVTDALTDTLRHQARAAGVPVVGVYETMPVPGYRYQSWMLAEVRAVQAALASGTSTEKL